MSYHWRSSDARELFEKTVLRRVSLVVLVVVLCMSSVSTGRLVIDQHCLHGQYHSLFTNTTCAQSTCSRVISPDRQPYIITQEELPSASRLSMGYSISLWIQVDTAENYTNRHLISLTDSRGKDLWGININGISGRRNSRTISLLIKSVLYHKPNILLSVRTSSNKQQSATWHSVLFSFHSNGQITPYFDGFVGEQQWIPVVNSENHHIILGANKDKHLHYKDPLVFTRALSEADAVALQQNHHLTDGATLYPHCLCPEGYTLSSINQYLCVSGNDDQQVSRIKDDTVDTIIWPQHDNKRLKRNSDEGSGDIDEMGSGMDSSIITSLPFTSSMVTVFSSVTIETSTLITSEVDGSGRSTILISSGVTSTIPFTSSSPVSPLSSPPIVSSTVLPTSEVTQSVSVTESTVISTVNASAVSTIEITPSFTLTPSPAINTTTGGIFSTIEVTPTFTVTPSTSSAVFSSIEVTPTFSSATSNITTTDITPSFTMSITDTVVSSAINITSVVVSTSLFSETISTIIATSQFSPTATSSVIVTSSISPTEGTTSLELFTSTSMSSITVSPTLETIVSTQSLAVTVTPTSSFTIAPTVVTLSSATELTSVFPTSTISSSIEIVTSTELTTQTTSFTALPTTPFSTSSEFISPTSSIPTISSAITSEFTSTTFMLTTVSPTDTTASPSSITNFTTVLLTSDTGEFTPTTIPSLASSLVISTTEIVPTMITSVLTSETLSSTIDVTSSFEATFTSSIEASPTMITSVLTSETLSSTVDVTSSLEATFTSSIEASPTMITSVLTSETLSSTIDVTSSFEATFTSTISPTMITSVLTSETQSSTVDVTSSLEATFTSSIEASPTMITSVLTSETLSSTIDVTSSLEATFTSSFTSSIEASPTIITSVLTSETQSSTVDVTSSLEATFTSSFTSSIEASPTIITSVLTSETQSSTVDVTSSLEATFTSSIEASPTIITSVLTSETQSSTVDVTSSFEATFTSSIETSPTMITSVLTGETLSSTVDVTSSLEATFTSSIEASPTIITSVLTSETPSSTIDVTSSLEATFTSGFISSTEASPTIITSVLTSETPSSTVDVTSSLEATFTSNFISSIEASSTMITSVLTSETPSSTIDVTSSLEATFTSSFISSIEASPTSSFDLTSEASSPIVISTSSSTEFVPTMTTSGVVNVTNEIPSSSLVPTSEVELTTTSPTESITPSTIEVFPTLTSSNTTDFTPTPSFTATPTTSVLQSSPIASSVFTSEVVLNSTATETVSETLAPSTEFTSTVENTQPTLISSSLVTLTSSSAEVLSTMTSIIEPTSTFVSSSFISLTTNSAIDITTTVASSVDISTSATNDGSSTIIPTFAISSDTINVTLSSSFSSLQPITSTVELTSSPSMVLSSTEFISSTISEVISSTTMLPTQTFITSAEITPSTIMPSSALPTTTSPVVSPMPTMLECSSGTMLCDVLTACIPTTQDCPNVPKAPITVSAESGGFLIDEIMQDENNSNQYKFKFGNFINAQNEGTINSNLGSLQDSEAFAIPSQINYSSLEGHILQNEIAPGDPIHVVVQAHNLSILSTSPGSFPVVISVNDINTDYFMQDECTISVNSGYCIGRIDLEGLSSTSTAVSISVMEKNNLRNRDDVGQVEILEIAKRNSNINNAILMKLPTHTVYPPDDVTVTISSIGYSVKSLLLNCIVNDSSATIMTLPKNNWSTLSINNNTENQLAISHERVTEAENEDEEEILCMKINFKDFSADRVEVKCELNELLLTNRVLVDDNIAVLDRNNMRNSSGYIFLANENVINYLVAYTNKTVLFNSAIINGGLLEYDLVVKGITVTGEVVDLTDLHCNSSDSDVLKVMEDCSRVFLDGTETAGSISVTINVYYESLNTTVALRVWYPETPVLEAEDTVLNAISNWPRLGCNHRYQQTLFRVFANVSDGTRTIYRIDVTSFISDILMSSNEAVLKVFPNATVQGVSPGTATVTGNNNIPLLQFNVSDEPVEAAALEVLLYNNLNVTIPQNISLYEETYGTVTLTQESDRAKLLFVNVLFNDSQRMELRQSDYIVNSTCPDSIAVRDNLIHPIGNTSGYKECVKVTLIRDEACNVTDTVEGVANVSIQLSTPDNLEIKLSTHEIIADENISMITGVSTEITLQAILHFSNGDQIDITLANETNITTTLNMTRSTDSLTLSASPEHANNEYNINITNSLYNISSSTSVNVVQGTTVNLSVHPYPEYSNSNSTNMNCLSRIGNTNIYQQALLKVVLTLPNGSNYTVTDSAHFEMIPTNILTLSSDGIVTVNSNITEDTNYSVDITAQFSSLVSESVTIKVRSEPVQVRSIDDVIFVSEFRGVQNSTQSVDASVTLSDDTVLVRIYERNISGLLRFSVSDTTTASVDGNTVTLLGNSLTDNYITAHAVGQNNLSENTTFRCDLVAGLHDVDLGTNLSLPIAVDSGDRLESPVHVNSENADLGIFELSVSYSSRELEVENVVPGEDWATGSLVYQVVTIDDNIDMVSFGGINYQGGKGKSIHVANITFKANTRGTVILNSTIALLAKADLTSELIAEEDRDSTAGSSLMVYVNEKQMRRDVSYDEPPLMSPQTEIHNHHKRQSGDSDQEFSVGDVNRDGEVDLRDVNYLRHYQVENIYDFTSPAGQEILMTRDDILDSLDVNGDGQINSLDTTELENINFDLLRIIDNVTALCSYDSGVCTCTVTGELYTVDMQPSPTDDVFILVDFGSTNQSFQDEFNNTFTQNGSVVSYNKGDGLYGGIVLAEIVLAEINSANTTTFVVKTNYSFSTPDIGISLIQITVDANNETSNERQSIHVKSGSIYSNTLNVNVSIPDVDGMVNIIIENGYSPFMNLSNNCPVVVENTTSSTMTTPVSTSSLVVPTTTAVSTTLVTTSASSLVITTTILDTSSTFIVTSSTSEIASISTSSISTAATSSVASSSVESSVASSSVETSEVSSTPTPLISATTTSSVSPIVTTSTSEVSNFSTSTTAITRSTSEIDSISIPPTSAATTLQTSTTMMISSSSEIRISSTTTLSPSAGTTSSASPTVTSSMTEISNTSTPSTSSTATSSTISEITASSSSTPASVASSSQASTTTASSSEISTSSASTMLIPATTTSSVSQPSTTSISEISTETSSATSQTPTTTTTIPELTTSSTLMPATTTEISTSSIATTTTISELTTSSTSIPATTTSVSLPPTTTEISTSSTATSASATSQTSSTPAVATSTTSTTSDLSMSGNVTTSVPTTSTPTTDITADTSSGGGGSTGAVVAVVVILVVIATTVVIVLVVCWYRRSKKRKTYYFNPTSRPSSGLSSNYWFQEEEKIEMSPIDIVPMAPSPCDEQFRDTTHVVVPNGINGIGYRNIGYASGTQRSADGGTKPGYFKPSAESSAGPPPPPYTSRHQRNSTAFDDEVNLSFHDELISQPYLSLGLTPLSQLSPPDSQDVGFFPSLPPPIATTVDDHSIPVDGPLFIGDDRKLTKRNRRTGLETVPEQPTSPTSNKYSQGSNPLSPFQRSTQPEGSLVFPSASISQDYLRALSNTNVRTASPNYGARNFGFSSQYEDDPLIDFNDYGSGYSMHVDSSPDSKRNGRNLNYHGVSRDSPPDEHHSQFTRGDLRRQGVKRSRGDLSSQRCSQEMMLRQPIRKVYEDDDDDDDLTTVLVPRPTSPPGVYPPQLSDIHNFTPPVKDQNYGSISSIPSFKEDHHATTLL